MNKSSGGWRKQGVGVQKGQQNCLCGCKTQVGLPVNMFDPLISTKIVSDHADYGDKTSGDIRYRLLHVSAANDHM